MNKSTIVFAALALLAASCTKTELVTGDAQSAQRGIGFSAYTAKHTKAAQTDVTTGNFDSFEVTAIGNGAIYFDNVTFSKGASVWESNPLYFWPAYALDFYAYNTPANGNGTFTRNITTTAPQTLTYSPAAELSKQEDLVAVSATGKTESDNNSKSAIELTFNHYLTQVVVNAKCSNSGYIVVVDGVKLANLAGEGTYTFSTDKMVATSGLVNSATSSDYSSTFTAKPLTSSPQEVMADGTGKWYLVPQTVKAWDRENNMTNKGASSSLITTYDHGTYLALKVKITSKAGNKIYPVSGDKSAWMAVPVPEALKFEQGKKYNVTLDFFGKKGAGYVDPENPGELDGKTETSDAGKSIVGGAIKFDATVTEWGDAVNVVISL